jgi:maleylacetate reductase
MAREAAEAEDTDGVINHQYERLGQRIQVGTSNALSALVTELEVAEHPRVLLIGSKRAAQFAAEAISCVAHIDQVRRHVPLRDVVAARDAATSASAQVIVSIGGGSATGLAKAVALELHLPIIAIPTTFAGSEATPIWGITENQQKVTGVASQVLPVSVLYDTELFAAIPRDLAVTSAINALAHGVDALWAPKANPFAAADAEGGIRLLAEALPALQLPPSREVIRRLIVGTYLSSSAFASAGSGMHHKICHVLGGTFDLPHAPLHTLILPYVLAFNARYCTAALAALGRAFQTDTVLETLLAMYDLVSAPRSLAELGFRESDIDEAAALCLEAIPPSNPRPVDLASIRELLFEAWAGVRPHDRSTS